ncbi:MAG TPA: extracellular solute-binding protein [Candidatus Acetatifactor stercoripullorum]|uniref:Extracellular solute-binding protein n=1 Tax=Candidatus Acetatifactor stercoripullorum TaxID=2838414 RepID=A0A9D1R667_9FIRM|nr:extracellular solute-binding protein [uncultured Acetatifactor sp.]HIW80801.1 extracellular solute-binding protein [Candidatus Acetatifactor stercoripullorum]
MKKGRKWKLLAGAMALVMTAGSLTACGSNEGQQAADSQPQSVAGTESAAAESAGAQESEASKITFPLAEQVELTIATPDSSVASLADQLPVWQEIQERTNIKINWDVTASAQYVEVMKLRVTAGGGDLPDIMLLPNGLSLSELGEQGIILPLESYIETNGENILKAYEEFPNARALTSADGHIYSINQLNESAYFSPYTFIIRKDWLDRLGLEVPDTIDDWMEVLRAFRDEDANGNGNPDDEVPYSAGGHAWYPTYWGNAWGLHLFQSDGWYPDENGQIQYEFISDRAKEFYTWLNGFYEEGLLDPEFLTLGDESKMFEKVARDEVGAFTAYASNIPTLEAALEANGVEGAELIPVIPPQGPYARQVEIIGDMSVNGYVVTSSCENPDVAVAFMDYLMSEEGSELLNFGIEGDTYVKEADGTYTFTEKVTNDPNGLSAREALEAYGCQVGGPFIKSEKREEAMLFSYPEELRETIIEVSDATRPYIVPGLTLPPATAEESASIEGIAGDLSTYIWEMTGKFTVGVSDIEAEWDSYVEYVHTLGVDQLLAVKQAQYDRLQEAMAE